MSFSNRGLFSVFHWPALLAMIIACTVPATVSWSAESLPPLRADPTLLGGAPLPPAQASATTTDTAAAATAPDTSSPVAASPAAAKDKAEASGVAATSPAAATDQARQAAAPIPKPAPAAQAQPAETRQAVVTLPPLRVDPALLGGAAAAVTTAQSTATTTAPATTVAGQCGPPSRHRQTDSEIPAALAR